MDGRAGLWPEGDIEPDEPSRGDRHRARGDRQPAPQEAVPTVAAFDFDGTLTRRGSLLPFLVYVRGPLPTARAVITEFPRFARVVLGRTTRDEAKEALLARLLTGIDAEQLADTSHAFAQRLVARQLRPGMRQRLDWHRRAGHRVVIVSASPTLYLEPAGRWLGVDAVLATELEVGPDARLTGKLAGPNCRGPEKARRLRRWLETAPADEPAAPNVGGGDVPDRPSWRVWAYGDSRGDSEILALADVAVWVGWRKLRPPRARRS